MERLNGLDLFSGIGGNTLGLQNYIKTIAYCEYDRHAQSVLLSRMSDGSIKSAPIWDDITTLTGKHFDIPVDIIVGGFPCQDISVAGKGVGIKGGRSGLFFEIMRLTDEIRPRLLFLENVPAIRTRGLDVVLQELTQRGYDCRWTMLSAAQVGAPHKRERWFMLAHRTNPTSTYPEHIGRNAATVTRSNCKTVCGGQEGSYSPGQFKGVDSRNNVANTDERGLQAQGAKFKTAGLARENRECRRSAQSRLDRMADGLSDTVDKSVPEYLTAAYWQEEPENIPRVTQEKEQRTERIKRLGNSVVPLQAKTAFECLIRGLA